MFKAKFKIRNMESGAELGSKHYFVSAEDGDLSGQKMPTANDIACVFTGLPDGPGNEIYEGDVLRDSESPLRLFTVSYQHGSFCLLNPDGSEYSSLYDINEEMEIVGNRWQPAFKEKFGGVE